eukprot:TRINITY_DN1544_c0_g1_i1.p1 TRINITY_DN1544_c0_g1~~TRINITY_DN1544_c0_g1_i1.p1  ORF type:complete len:176 (-),score=13.91 TRINITY_DN1544_c0_g1_i1:198-725(-)
MRCEIQLKGGAHCAWLQTCATRSEGNFSSSTISMTIDDILNPDDCCKACVQYCECDAWTWHLHEHQCYLYHTDDFTDNTLNGDFNYMSAELQGRTADTMSPGSYTHNILDNHYRVQSMADCILLCKYNPRCRTNISYHPSRKHCKTYGDSANALSDEVSPRKVLRTCESDVLEPA